MNFDYFEYLLWFKDVIPGMRSVYQKFLGLDDAPLFVPKWKVVSSIGDDIAAMLETSPLKPKTFGANEDPAATQLATEAELDKAGFNPAFIILVFQIVKLIRDLRNER